MFIRDLKDAVEANELGLEIALQHSFGALSVTANNSVVAQISKYKDGLSYLFINKCKHLASYLESKTLNDLKLDLVEKKGRSLRSKSPKVAVFEINSYTATELEAVSKIFAELTYDPSSNPSRPCNSPKINVRQYDTKPLSNEAVMLMASMGKWDISELFHLTNIQMYEMFRWYRNTKEFDYEKVMFELLSAVKIARKNREYFQAKKLYIDGLEVSLSRLARGRA